MGNFRIERLDMDVAETEAYAIAVHVLPATPDTLRMLSLRYIDRLVRRPDGWKIAKRVQTVEWGCAIPATTAATLAQRVMGLAGA
jgi:ribosomal protein L30/L7E